jgi:CRP-like cAMP-binding protein
MDISQESERCCGVLIEALRTEGVVCSLPPRTTLFTQGETAQGIHIVSRGCVKLSINSCEGRVFILKVSERGEILGLHNCISDTPYEMTAQTILSSRVCFVNRENLVRVLHRHPEASLAAATQLAKTCHIAYDQIILLSTSHSAREKLARFLLALSTASAYPRMGSDAAVPVELDLTHDDIAQAIGTARETVSRVLAKFRRENLATLTGPLLLVLNRAGLETVAGMRADVRDSDDTTQALRRHGPVSVAGRPIAVRSSVH